MSLFRDQTTHLPRVGAAFGALTAVLGGGMIWTTTPSPGLPVASSLCAGIVVSAALGWFGTERILALGADLEGAAE